MTWQVSWTRRAERDAEGLDGVTRQRVDRALDRLARTGDGDLIKLKGYDETWRLRVGDWRVLLTFDGASQTISVLRVLPRQNAYRA